MENTITSPSLDLFSMLQFSVVGVGVLPKGGDGLQAGPLPERGGSLGRTVVLTYGTAVLIPVRSCYS